MGILGIFGLKIVLKFFKFFEIPRINYADLGLPQEYYKISSLSRDKIITLVIRAIPSFHQWQNANV